MSKVSQSTGFIMFQALAAIILVFGFLGFLVTKNERARSGGVEVILDAPPVDPRDIFFGNYATFRYAIENQARTSAKSLADFELLAAAKAALITDRTANESAQFWRTVSSDVFVVLTKDGTFHRIRSITTDFDKARASGAPFLAGEWHAADRSFGCSEEEKEADECWSLIISFDLPSRYYADPETALALEALSRDAGGLRRAAEVFEECERQRAELAAEDAVSDEDAAETELPRRCNDAVEPTEIVPEFGVIMSVSKDGEAAIKGVYNDGEFIYDSLTGRRLSTADID